MTKNPKVTLLCLSLVNLTAYLTMSIIAPFFPYEASVKGMRESLAGFVFSVYAFVMMVSSPLLGKLLPVVGVKFMLLSGIWFSGWSNVLFGVLEDVHDTTTFTVLCFVVRAVGAFGAASFSTASYTYIIHLFPENVGLAFGLTETCVGIGMSLGPAVGGLLYGIGGYSLPFYVLGSFILATGPLCMFFVQPLEIEMDSDLSSCSSSSISSDVQPKTTYAKLVTIPKVLVMCLVLMTATTTQGFLDPTIEPHFRQYGIAPEYVGLVFLTMSAAYTISSPISGWFAGRVENKAPLMVIGLVVTSLGYVLLGPSKFLGLEPSFWLSSVSMMILGFAYSLAFIPTFETILEAVIDRGLPDDVRTYSLVSGLWSCVNSLGEVAGAALGGVFMEHFSFTYGANSVAIWTMGTALVLLITYLVDLCSHQKTGTLSRSSSYSGIRRPSRGFSISVDRSATLLSDERIRLLIHHKKSKGSSKHRDFIQTIP